MHLPIFTQTAADEFRKSPAQNAERVLPHREHPFPVTQTAAGLIDGSVDINDCRRPWLQNLRMTFGCTPGQNTALYPKQIEAYQAKAAGTNPDGALAAYPELKKEQEVKPLEKIGNLDLIYAPDILEGDFGVFRHTHTHTHTLPWHTCSIV